MNFNEKITPHKICNIILIAKEVIICQEYIKLELEKKEYKTWRRSNYLLGLLCKIILLRRRLKNFIIRTLHENKVLFYLFIGLILIYSLLFLIDKNDINASFYDDSQLKMYIKYVYSQKDIFITSVITVLFINVVTSVNKRKRVVAKTI